MKLSTMKLLALFLVSLATFRCGDTYIRDNPTAPPPPTPPPVVIVRNFIEFRVIGSPTLVRVRYADPQDGLSQLTTGLPFSAAISTTQTFAFLSLDVTPIAFPVFNFAPFLSAQIIVNGFLFREASTTDTTFNTLSVSGTWRAISQ